MRELKFDDYPQIASLHERNGLLVRSHEAWISVWKGNPFYEDCQGHWPLGWVLENGAGKIVGSIQNIPYAYRFQGRNLRAAAACAWAVDQDYRGYSMSLIDRLSKQSDVDLLLTTTASVRSEKVCNFLQWTKVPVGTWNKSAFWIANYQGFLQSVFRTNRAPWLSALSYPVSAILFCRDWLGQSARCGNNTLARLELCACFDSRFDDFWEELEKQKRPVLLAVRTRAALIWHFRHLRMGENGWIFTASRGSRIVAYAIFDRNDNTARRIKRVRLIDFQALEGFEDVLRSVIDSMLGLCHKEGIHIIENIGCWIQRPDLPQIHSYRRSLGSWMFYYKAADRNLRLELTDASVWRPSSFDGDVSI